ncbi:dTMP kinase [Hyphomicrobium sp. CS1GBMeth3]|uniref:dTMP kinase n=1 Tax=Hyphomicrobium sp. CS1GBMeth3 TaxID=1892845 RepID=UPI000930B8DF|nr:dTMP kinase [Hyphomicrobium sp. CS1GBMeth3]
MRRGKFITFEGGEGAGKSTQVALLAERLRGAGIETVITREPGGTALGEAIRDVVLQAEPDPVTELLLFAAARAEHVAKVIRPALEHGTWVVSDRFADSTRVYQGVLAGVPQSLIEAVEAGSVAPTFPDLTLILDIPIGEGQRRTEARGALSRFDAADGEYHERLRQAFRDIARAEPQRCLVIDGTKKPDEIGDEVWRAVETRLLAEG